MRNLLSIGILAMISTLSCGAQWPVIEQPGLDGSSIQQHGSDPLFAKLQGAAGDEHISTSGSADTPSVRTSAIPGGSSNFSYYLTETYLNPGLFTAPAFRASLRMAHPPGSGPTRYPYEWRQGAEGFGRNYGDAFATRISTHTAQYLLGTLTREDLRYVPSSSYHFFTRTSHAIAFTFVDRSRSGRCVPALSNFAGAAVGGFVGNAYLPNGFTDATHAGQRAEFQLGMMAAGNLFREFAPQMPAAVREFFMLIAR